MSISQENIEKVKESIDIVEMVTKLGRKVTKKGKYYFTQCPFHTTDSDGDGGSCTLYRDTSSYHCWGCGASGSIFCLYCQILGVPFKGAGSYFPKAVEELHEMFNLPFALNKVTSYSDEILDKCTSWIGSLRECSSLQIGNFTMRRWTIGSAKDYESLPFFLSESIVNISDDYKYPQYLMYCKDIDKLFVVEKGTAKLIKVFLPNINHANFTCQRNPSKLMSGLELDNICNGVGTFPLFDVRIAVENPIDYIILASQGYAVSWGIWGLSTKGESLVPMPTTNSNGNRIPCLIALHLGKNKSSHERFIDTLYESDIQWLPREVYIEKLHTLLSIRDDTDKLSSLYYHSNSICLV